ncbi:MAG: hypothetical protein AVDCRST_MAG78-672, partial [uncultured Rubrobacteraceae bacterium]
CERLYFARPPEPGPRSRRDGTSMPTRSSCHPRRNLRSYSSILQSSAEASRPLAHPFES